MCAEMKYEEEEQLELYSLLIRRFGVMWVRNKINATNEYSNTTELQLITNDMFWPFYSHLQLDSTSKRGFVGCI